METLIINKNALYREMMLKHGRQHTYIKVSSAIDGGKDILTKEEAKQLIQIIEDSLKIVKSNITASISKF